MRAAACQSPQLRLDVGPGPPLPTPPGDGGAQGLECGDHRGTIGFPAPTFAFVDPVGRGAVSTFAVAAGTGGEFVLDPRRTTLDARDQVFGGGPHPIGVDRSAAPHAGRTVAIEHDPQTFATTGQGPRLHGRDDTTDALASVGWVTILVDAAIWPFDGRRWAHLVSDESLEELHEFAARLGIPRRGFQGDHYDVPSEWRLRAIEMGAVPVTSRELLHRLRAAGLRRPRRPA